MAARNPPKLQPTTRIRRSNGTQLVTIPPEFQFPAAVREVLIRRAGESVILTPRPTDWAGFFAGGKASSDFMLDVQSEPEQKSSF